MLTTDNHRSALQCWLGIELLKGWCKENWSVIGAIIERVDEYCGFSHLTSFLSYSFSTASSFRTLAFDSSSSGIPEEIRGIVSLALPIQLSNQLLFFPEMLDLLFVLIPSFFPFFILLFFCFGTCGGGRELHFSVVSCYTLSMMLGNEEDVDSEEIICKFLVGTNLVTENHELQTFKNPLKQFSVCVSRQKKVGYLFVTAFRRLSVYFHFQCIHAT